MEGREVLVSLLILLPLGGSVGLLAFGRRLGEPWAGVLGTLTVGAGLVLAGVAGWDFLAGTGHALSGWGIGVGHVTIGSMGDGDGGGTGEADGGGDQTGLHEVPPRVVPELDRARVIVSIVVKSLHVTDMLIP